MLRRAYKPAPPEKPLIQRALELARTGNFATFADVEKVMHAEGYSKIDAEWNGKAFRNQVRSLIRGAKPDR